MKKPQLTSYSAIMQIEIAGILVRIICLRF